MAWTAEKKGKGVSSGLIYVTVEYVNDSPVDSFFETYNVRSIRPDWPDAAIRARLDELESIDLDQIKLGAPAAATPPVEHTPTQDELDQKAFIALAEDWRIKKAALNVSKELTQQDVDAAYDALKAAFKEEYAALVVGLF